MDSQSASSSLDNYVRMVANVYDAHTAALFVQLPHGSVMELVAKESLSRQVVSRCVIRPGEGVLGWVAKERRRLHVTRFDRDTRTLGIYGRDVKIRALLAAPLPEGRGVLMVDSRNRHAFPEKKQKILDDFAAVAWDLWNARRCRMELEFYRTFSRLVLEPGLSLRRCVTSIAGLMGLDTVVMASMVRGRRKYTVELVWRRGADSDRWKGRQFGLDEGYAGWFFRKGLSLIMKDFKGDAQKCCLLGSGDVLCRGEVLAGVVIRRDNFRRIVMFTGEADVTAWPDELLDLISRAVQIHSP